MARILVLNPFGGYETYAEQNLRHAARPDTEFSIENIAEHYPLRYNSWLYFRHECINFTIERVLAAEAEAYDAVFLSCMTDVGLYECRHLVDIPITASLESAALLAYQMGRSFSIISVDRQNGEQERMLLDLYGLSGKLVSVRPFDIPANELYPDRTPSEAVVDRLLETARLCVAQDGAEVIIPGCTLASSVLTRELRDAQSILGVPVIDGMIAGFKAAEMWCDLVAGGLPPTSKHGFFQHPPEEALRAVREAVGKPFYGRDATVTPS
jgi:allantoin racemase